MRGFANGFAGGPSIARAVGLLICCTFAPGHPQTVSTPETGQESLEGRGEPALPFAQFR